MTIMNFLLIILAIVLTALWIKGLANSDGRCHYESCDHCPYDGQCPEQERKRR